MELEELERRAEMRNPARHNHAHYFSGSVEEAITVSRARQGFLVVFLKGCCLPKFVKPDHGARRFLYFCDCRTITHLRTSRLNTRLSLVDTQ